MFRVFDHKSDALPICEGGCQCGSVRYECPNQPLELYVCHCLECRHQSASAFGISYIVARDNFQLTRGRGSLKSWTRGADSGQKVECVFCAECGSRLWHQYSGTSETLSIKGGSLDKTVDISNAVHIWTIRKLSGVVIPENAKQFDKEPEEVAPIYCPNSPSNINKST